MKKFGKIINLKSFKNTANKINPKGAAAEKPAAGSDDVRKSALFLWVMALIATASLTILLTPSFKSDNISHNPGDIALRDIKAPEDILIEDKATTIKNKKIAEETSPDIYDFDTKMTRDFTNRVSLAFDLMTKFYKERVPDIYSFIEREEERTEIDTESIKLKREMTVRLNKFESSDEFRAKETEFQAILKIELSDKGIKSLRWHHYKKEIRDNINDFISQVMGIGVVGSMEFVNMDRETLLREIGADTERVLPDASSIIDVRQADELIKRLAEEGIQAEHKSLQAAVINICQKLIQPNLTFNKKETEKRRGEAVESEKPVFYQIKKGEMIIREGERFTEEHVLKLKSLESKQAGVNSVMAVVGYAVIVMLFLYIFWIYLKRFKPLLILDIQSLLLLELILIFNIAGTKLFITMFEAIGYTGSIEVSSYIYAVPFAVGPMLVAILFEVDVALIFSLLNSFLIGFLIKDGFAYSLVSLAGGLITTYKANQYKKRSSILKTGLLVSVASAVIIIPLDLINNTLISKTGFYDVAFGLLGGVIVAIIVSGALPLIESLFHVTSDIKLLELSDLNHPLLSELVVQAPGTYHHSIIVGNLAEDAAEAIGANPLFARVASYFHDIGKMRKPEYFIENQHGAINKHDGLAPSMSSLILTSHIKDGVELARSHRLIPRIIDIIKEHHGTSLITYFYNRAKEMEDPSIHEVREEDFRYPGPKPNTKESAIVLLADSVEAASRTLDEPTSSRLRGLVQKIIDDKFIDGQLDHSNLTLNDLHKITNSFVRILTGIFHYRIEYPEIENEKEERAGLHANNDSEPKPHEDRPKESKKAG
ncbi:MAG: HDIG domain-containing protein [Nitrospinae bacterium]|nr:HDIG domain-containing protein [Nitrospinota bacterium]